jgi:hypothetical protein
MLPLIQALISSGELAWPSEIQATPGDDLAQRAVAALEGIVLDEGRLQRVQRFPAGEALDGRDLGAIVHDRERETGVDPPPVQENGARAQRPGCNPSWFR